MRYREEVLKLAPLESFDAKAFIGSADVPQSLCGFVLALALAHNDLKDLILARLLLGEVRPTDARISPERGQYGGLGVAVLRLQTGRVHELLKLIAKSGAELEHAFFKSILRNLSKAGRTAWSALSLVAQETKIKDKTNELPMVRALRLIRNEVAFHYDAGKISEGYGMAFNASAPQQEPLLSRGGSLQRSRFYFVDAAIEAFIREKGKDQVVDDFLHGRGEMIDNINQALYEIVTKFITARGAAWRNPA